MSDLLGPSVACIGLTLLSLIFLASVLSVVIGGLPVAAGWQVD